MYEILVPVDEEDRASAQVESLLGLPFDESTIRVVLFHVFTDNPEGASALQTEAVHAALDLLEETRFDVTVDEASGDPSTEIVAEAERRDVDLILLAGRKRSPAGKALFGSVTQSVILDTDRSVVVCGSRKQK